MMTTGDACARRRLRTRTGGGSASILRPVSYMRYCHAHMGISGTEHPNRANRCVRVTLRLEINARAVIALREWLRAESTQVYADVQTGEVNCARNDGDRQRLRARRQQ